MRQGMGRRVLKGMAILAAAVVGSGLVLVMSLAVERQSIVTLPVPTGPYAVGRVGTTWTDPGAVDPWAPVPGTARSLAAWIWYPAAAEAGTSAPADYMPPAWQAAVRQAQSPVMAALTHDPARVLTHSRLEAAVSDGERAYPVVILRAGASAQVLGYSTIAEDLASHGYVVVGFDAPYRTTVVVLDGHVIRRRPENNPELYSGEAFTQLGETLVSAWAADIGFALDELSHLNQADPSGRFTGRLDLLRVGVMGHSLGGATAAEFCRDDRRCQAGIDIDGALIGPVIASGVDRPFMFLVSQMGDFSSADDVRRIRADIDSVYRRLPRASRAYFSIRGANHFTFSDDGALLKSPLVRGLMRTAQVLRIDGVRQLAVTLYAVHTFFDAYLKGRGPRPLEESPAYPELEEVQ
jgi:dienelactone hydrolase